MKCRMNKVYCRQERSPYDHTCNTRKYRKQEREFLHQEELRWQKAMQRWKQHLDEFILGQRSLDSII